MGATPSTINGGNNYLVTTTTAGGRIADASVPAQIQPTAACVRKKGWRKAGGEIKNLEIIRDAYALYVHLGSSVQLAHVSAHVGTAGNELADRMAMFAVQSGCEDLWLYSEELDVAAILRMRAG